MTCTMTKITIKDFLLRFPTHTRVIIYRPDGSFYRDTAGNVIQTPGIWDATDFNAEIVPGSNCIGIDLK